MERTITYKHIFDSTSNGVIATDAGGRIVLINNQAVEILGLNEKEIIGADVRDFFPLSDRLISQCIENGHPRLGRHVNGKDVNIVVNITTIKEDGKIIGIVINFQKTKQIEISAQQLESYKQLNKQLETIFNSSFDGILVCDNRGNIIKMNKASEKLNAVKAKEWLGKNVADFVSNGIIEDALTLKVIKKKRQMSQIQTWAGKKLLTTVTPALDEKGNVSLVVINERDITQLIALKKELEETRLFKKKYKNELAALTQEKLKQQDIIATSDEMKKVLETALKIAQLNVHSILILGESGTGKGIIAKFIHNNSYRSKSPFFQINCAALPKNLLEAELFGYEKGAFTGAKEEGKIGLFEVAEGGTLLLDEIGDLTLEIQAKLLKCLEDHEIIRLGGTKHRKVDCTIIAATNRNIEALVKKNMFRLDLFYRINAFTILIPPLRERLEDIFALANHFIDKYNKMYGRNKRLSNEILKVLQGYAFPGNVRELKNIIQKNVVMNEQDLLDELHMKSRNYILSQWTGPGNRKEHILSLRDEVCAVERKILKIAMARCKTTREMASYLRTTQPTVIRKMKKHGLSRV